MSNTNTKESIVVMFAGDSGDGMQLTGGQFTYNTAIFGNDLRTFPDFPSEIRAPRGTVSGVSGFQIQFGDHNISTPGDECDILVAMNAAALKKKLDKVKKGGTIIIDESGFDKKNLRLAKYEDGVNPLETSQLDSYKIHKIDITKRTIEALEGMDGTSKDKTRSKNMFVLGFIYWLHNRGLDSTEKFLKEKFAKKPLILKYNLKALKTGYNYGDTINAISRNVVKPTKWNPGVYRNITGNEAAALGLISASEKSGLELVYCTYPITPASDILHHLVKNPNFNIKVFQAEDEIAAVTSAIGVSFAGSIGVTGSSGPGIALKGEGIGLATILEIPLVIINVQRGGPSTGLPTKTEQSDLLQAFYGRNGEAPMPILAAKSPAHCFEMTYKAVKIALEHMTPVMVLSDGYLANGSEPWEIVDYDSLEEINSKKIKHLEENEKYLPYKRDENLVRDWAVPGVKNAEHRLGGLEKEDITGNVSYNPENHQKMTDIRQEKVSKIANFIPIQEVDNGSENAKNLILSWGGTYGSVKASTTILLEKGVDIAHCHLQYINPMPRNLKKMLSKFDKVIVPELNSGQLSKIIRQEFLIETIDINKVQGQPFMTSELVDKIIEICK